MKMKRKRGNAKNKTKLSPVCNVDEVIQNVVRANRDEWGFDANYEGNERVDTEMTEKSNKKTNNRASGQNAKEIEKPTNSFRGVSPFSSGAEQVHNERSPRTVPPHQDMQFKNHELKAALAVVKKVMKMDAAAPFNLPVDPAALGIPSQLRDAAQKQGTLEKDTIADEVFDQVMGEETRGRVCIPGVGPTLNNLRTSKRLPVEAERIVSEANAEVREMREKMVIMEQTCAQMATQIATMMTMMQKKFPDKDSPDEDAPKSSERFEHSVSSSHDDLSLQRSTRSGKK